jgi:hypothetical protein
LEVPVALKKLGITQEQLLRKNEAELRSLIKRLNSLSEKLKADGPQNDDELHYWVKINIGVDIPRTSVCEDHVAPFSFLADLFFERVDAAFGFANRGGAKTFIVAILHYINSTFKPGCESLTVGATEQQGNRCYSNIEEWCYERDSATGRRTDIVLPFIRDKPKRTETVWKTGSKVEIVAGTESAVSGPHSSKTHTDEIEQMDAGTWTQVQGVGVANPATGPLPKFMEKFNGMIPPQDIATSTRNSLRGRVQEILDEIKDDKKNGNIPRFEVYNWCIWETISQVANCRGADPQERSKACIEANLDPNSLCDCNRVVNGRMVDGTERTLEKICEGKAFRSRGWKPYIDLIRTFKRNTPGTWTLQHECREGQDENNYIQDWSLAQYGIRYYEPHPFYGPIYQGVDWGTSNPAAVLWFQYLTCEVPALGFEMEPIWLLPGTYVLFREIYASGVATDALAKRVLAIEKDYRTQFGHAWRVKNRFCDPQGLGDRQIFANYGLPSSWPVKTRNKIHMIETVQNIVIDDRFAVDSDQCPAFCEEVEGWQKNSKTGKELDKRNHAMSAWRYGISNAEMLEGKKRYENEEKNKRKREVIIVNKMPNFSQSGDFKLGSVAARGTTRAPLDPQFKLQHR